VAVTVVFQPLGALFTLLAATSERTATVIVGGVVTVVAAAREQQQVGRTRPVRGNLPGRR
jgi:hypothetical protein